MSEPIDWKARFFAALAGLAATVRRFPWRTTAAVLRERFREDRLGLTASSLTFTTMIALVPLVTLVLAVFTAFPMFAQLQTTLQTWLVQSLVPDNIARQVLGYLTQFSSKASRLGTVGLIGFVVTALALIFTIDRTLNHIWRVPKLRPFTQRLLIYWALLTLGPLLLAVSLSLTGYVMTASRGLVGAGVLRIALDFLQFALLSAGMAALFHYVPNTSVKWAHAWAGSLFVGLGFEVAKEALAWYLRGVPTYSMVYGAFATAPIFLLWIYIAWLIVMLGAVIAAYLPSLLAGVARRGGTPGWSFQLACEMLQELHAAKHSPAKGLDLHELAACLHVDSLQLQEPLAALQALDWIGSLESDEKDSARWILLAEPTSTRLEPLMRKLLLPSSNLPFYKQISLSPSISLDSLLQKK
jgi:membrane protein